MRKLLAIILTMLLMLTPIYSFADVVFNDYEGNDSFENKVDPPVNKVFYFNDEGEILTTESAIKVEFEV